MTRDTTRVGIVGATGYAGMELVRLLFCHPHFELVYLASGRGRPENFRALYPHLLHHGSALSVEQYDADKCASLCDLVFVALPSGQSGAIAADLWQRGKAVVDLSGDLRLDEEAYTTWYKHEAVDEAVRKEAVYGLTEFYRESIQGATLVANPGCYATAALLALKPLVGLDIVRADVPIVIDAKSGMTGAGRNPKLSLQFAELADDFYPYKIGSHQHTPEIEQELHHNYSVILTTQLMPIKRGILVNAYVPLREGVSAETILENYRKTYDNEYFVHVLEHGEVPHLKAVDGSNHCHLGLYAHEDHHVLQICSVIDNLQKGAAGQALQNANLMFGYEDTLGLVESARWM